MARRTLFIFLWCIFHAVTGRAETLNEQIQGARKSGNWSGVKTVVQTLADSNDPLYLTALGQMYVYGVGVPRDVSRAYSLFLKAAEKNFAPAQSFVGFFYATGTLVNKDSRAALDWYRKSAEQGFSEAQYNIGHMYHSGELGAVDEKAAIEWYEKAAVQRFPRAWLNLAALYLQGGKVVQKDIPKGLALMKQAANAGDTSAQFNLGMLYLRGDGMQADPGLAYYYLTLASSDDTRGPCLPPILWAAARLEVKQGMADELVIRDELSRQLCMRANPKGKELASKIEQLAEKYPDMRPVFQNARQAAARYLEQRKQLDEPVKLSSEKDRKDSYRGEYGFLMSLPHWEIVKLNERTENTILSEMRPPNETRGEWTKTARYEQTFKLKYARPQQHVEQALDVLRKDCGQLVENKVFDGDERGYPTFVMNTYCNETTNAKRAEMHFYKAVQGEDSFYFWHAIWRGETGAMLNQADATKKVIVELTGWLRSQVVCDLRVETGAKACPSGLPKSF
ncbi:MAG: sel1 repeat family protein [Sulfuritalea sp.]|nr:sel1 repeat family protein [Sulfuritalea sp.]